MESVGLSDMMEAVSVAQSQLIENLRTIRLFFDELLQQSTDDTQEAVESKIQKIVDVEFQTVSTFLNQTLWTNIGSLVEEMERLSGELDEKKLETEKVMKELNELQAKNKELEGTVSNKIDLDEYNKVKNELETLNEENTSLRAENASLLLDSDQKQPVENQELISAIESLQNEADLLRKELDTRQTTDLASEEKSRDAIEDLMMQLVRVTTEKEELNQQLKAEQAKINEKSNEINTLRSELQVAGTYQQTEEEISPLKAELEDLRQQLDQVTAERAKLAKQLENAQTVSNDTIEESVKIFRQELETENEMLRDELNSFSKEYDIIKDRNDQLMAENNELERKLHRLEEKQNLLSADEMEKLALTVCDLEDEKERLLTRLEQVVTENRKIRSDRSEIEQIRHESQEIITNLQEEQENLKKNHEESINIRNSLETKVSELNQEIEQIQRNLAQRDAEYTTLQDQYYHETQQSTTTIEDLRTKLRASEMEKKEEIMTSLKDKENELEEKIQTIRLLSSIVDTQELELQHIQNEQQTLLLALRKQQEKSKNFDYIKREYDFVSQKLALSLDIKEPRSLRDMIELLINYLTSAGEKLIKAKIVEKTLKEDRISMQRMETAISQLAHHDPKILTIMILAKKEKIAIIDLANETNQNAAILKMRLRRWADLGYVVLSSDFLKVQIAPNMIQ